MNLTDDTDGMVTQIAKGWVGREVAVMFQKFMTNEFSQLKAADILDKYEEMIPKIEAACSDIEVIAALANSLVDEVSNRSAAKMKEKQTLALKNFFGLIPKDVASNLWTSLLGNPKTKKIVMPWQSDADFCEVLRKVYGLAEK
jgi:hypothetical protein